MEKRKTGAGSRWAKGRRRELEKGPSLSTWAQDEQTAEEAVRRAQNAQESAQKANPLARNIRRT